MCGHGVGYFEVKIGTNAAYSWTIVFKQDQVSLIIDSIHSFIHCRVVSTGVRPSIVRSSLRLLNK